MKQTSWRLVALLTVASPMAALAGAHAQEPVDEDETGCGSLSCDEGHLFVSDGVAVTPFVQVVLGVPTPIDKNEGCALLVQQQREPLYRLAKSNRRERLTISDVSWGGVGIETCEGETQRSDAADFLAASDALVVQPLGKLEMSEATEHEVRALARKTLAAGPGALASAPGSEPWYDEVPQSPQWRIELHPWTRDGQSYVVAQGHLKLNPRCEEATDPGTCRSLVADDDDVAAAGVVLLRWADDPVQAAKASPQVVYSRAGRWDNDHGRIELVDVVSVRWAAAPWVVIRRTEPGYWNYELVSVGSAGKWQSIIVGGHEGKCGDGSSI